MTELFDWTWQTLDKPMALGFVVALVMVLLVRRIIVLGSRFVQSKVQDAELVVEIESIVVNAVTFGIAYGFAVARLEGASRLATMLALQGTAAAILQYEVVKNALKPFDVNVRSLSRG